MALVDLPRAWSPVGDCVIVREALAESVAERLTRYGEKVYRIGEVVKGSGRVRVE